MLPILHSLARFVDMPEHRTDIALVAREWDAPTQPAEGLSVPRTSVKQLSQQCPGSVPVPDAVPGARWWHAATGH